MDRRWNPLKRLGFYLFAFTVSEVYRRRGWPQKSKWVVAVEGWLLDG